MVTIKYVGKVRRLVFDRFMCEGDVRTVSDKQAKMLAGDTNFVINGKRVTVHEPVDSVQAVQPVAPAKDKKPRGRKKS
jgi:hypothetical protein